MNISDCQVRVQKQHLLIALQDWGSLDDPCQGDFIQGWYDQNAGKAPLAPKQIDRGAAYNSGFVAARENAEKDASPKI